MASPVTLTAVLVMSNNLSTPIIRAIDGIENKEFQNAFCLARPPGHHAEKNKAM